MRRRVLLGPLVVALTACGSSAPTDGGVSATEAMVLETCAPRADPVETEVCECAYRALQDRYDADELERLDRQLLDDPETVPAEVQEVVLACGFERVAPPTTKVDATTSTTATTSTSRPTVSSTTSTTRLP